MCEEALSSDRWMNLKKLLIPCRITKVKEFLKLVNFSEADGHLQQKLKQLLKLSKEKWEAACEHAKTAVQVTNSLMSSPLSISILLSALKIIGCSFILHKGCPCFIKPKSFNMLLKPHDTQMAWMYDMKLGR